MATHKTQSLLPTAPFAFVCLAMRVVRVLLRALSPRAGMRNIHTLLRDDNPNSGMLSGSLACLLDLFPRGAYFVGLFIGKFYHLLREAF